LAYRQRRWASQRRHSIRSVGLSLGRIFGRDWQPFEPNHVTGHQNQVVLLAFQLEVELRTDRVECNYTVIHKKRGSTFVIIALENLDRFLGDRL